METEINLVYNDEREAMAVAEAVSPDNIDVPSQLSIVTIRKGNEVNTKIKLDGRIQTLIATIDDLLACVSVAERTFNVAKANSKSKE